MKYIGVHISIKGGIFNVPLRAKNIAANTFACFTKNQRRWENTIYKDEDINLFKSNLYLAKIIPSKIVSHASYLINLGSIHKTLREQSKIALINEIFRCSQLGIKQIVFHPGNHLKLISDSMCLNYIAEIINEIFDSNNNNVDLVIENTAGSGGNVCYCFEHLAYLIDKIKNKNRIGVCLDTCHLFVAGYDFRTKNQYEKLWNDFDAIVGMRYLRVMHLNDCKSGLGSKLDRHESIGKGVLGLMPFKLLMQDSRLNDIPLILETKDQTIWHKEIQMLLNFSKIEPQ